MDMLSLSVLVLFLGFCVNRRVSVLEENYIPPAVTGGILFSLVTWFAYAQLEIQLEFDMRVRDLLLLVFFSTVGLSRDFGPSPREGRPWPFWLRQQRCSWSCRTPWGSGWQSSSVRTRPTACWRAVSRLQVGTALFGKNALQEK